MVVIILLGVHSPPHRFRSSSQDSYRNVYVFFLMAPHPYFTCKEVIFKVNPAKVVLAACLDVGVASELIYFTQFDFWSFRERIALSGNKAIYNVGKQDALPGTILPNQNYWLGSLVPKRELDVEILNRARN